MLKWLKAVTYSGRHHWCPSDMQKAGQVWWHGGEWWTFHPYINGRIPRLFNKRGNPLDDTTNYTYRW